MATALVNGRVLTPRPVEGRAVVLQGERIAGVVPVAELPASTPRRDLRGPGRRGCAPCCARTARPVWACWAP